MSPFICVVLMKAIFERGSSTCVREVRIDQHIGCLPIWEKVGVSNVCRQRYSVLDNLVPHGVLGESRLARNAFNDHSDELQERQNCRITNIYCHDMLARLDCPPGEPTSSKQVRLT